MTKPVVHATHPEIANRLKRAKGHLGSIVEMIETGRSCPEIAQQLHAVEKAVAKAKRVLIEDHLDHCLNALGNTANDDQRQEIEDFKTIAKYL
jgi:hypothetical protein NreA